MRAEWALWRHYSAHSTALNVVCSAVFLGAAYVLSSGAGMARRAAHVIALSGSAIGTVAVLEVPAIVFGHDYGLTLGTHDNDTWLQLALGINRRDDELIHVHRPHSQLPRYGGGKPRLARSAVPVPLCGGSEVRSKWVPQ